MADPTLGHDNEFAGVAAHAPIDERRGGTDKIGHLEHRLGTFGVCHDLRVGVLISRVHKAPHWERGMYHASALPDFHVFTARLLLDVIAEVSVGKKQNRFFRW